MKLKTIKYFYEPAHVIFYLRHEAPYETIFNDRIYINKRCKPLRVYHDYPRRLSLKIYKNTILNFISLRYGKIKGFCYDIILNII